MIMPSPSYANQRQSRQSYACIGKRQPAGKLGQKKVRSSAVALGHMAL
jgi:hypothetical protein